MEKRGLGRGLSALMADVGAQPTPEQIQKESELPIEAVQANPDQPRRSFSEDDLGDLAKSIAEKGILQPLIVRRSPENREAFQIVAGERRWRAAQLAGVHVVPAIIRDYSDAEVLEIAIIENIQRTDLNPIEEAMGYRQLMDKFGHTQEKLADAMGKSRSYIANLLRLLQLPDDITIMVRNGELSAGHARALITSDQPSSYAQKVVSEGLSVRETEKLVKQRSSKTSAPTPKRVEKDADTVALEKDLSANIGMSVAISHKANGEKGQVTISYRNLDELDAICRILTVN